MCVHARTHAQTHLVELLLCHVGSRQNLLDRSFDPLEQLLCLCARTHTSKLLSSAGISVKSCTHKPIKVVTARGDTTTMFTTSGYSTEFVMECNCKEYLAQTQRDVALILRLYLIIAHKYLTSLWYQTNLARTRRDRCWL